jgi:hypothetical protein
VILGSLTASIIVQNVNAALSRSPIHPLEAPYATEMWAEGALTCSSDLAARCKALGLEVVEEITYVLFCNQ